MNNIKLFGSALLVIATLLSSCDIIDPDGPDPVELPSVTTDANPMVYFSEAEVGGEVVNFSSAKSIGIYYGTDKLNLDSYAEAKVYEDGEYRVILKGLKSGTRYYYQAVAKMKKESVTGDIIGFITFTEGPVDLGLPSGLKWAAVNLGAEYPTDAGGYYAWGETRTKPQYDLTSYLYCEGKSGTWTKYYSRYKDTDGRTVLEMEDDAARTILGGKWRMPQAGEFRELVQNCACKIEIINGVKGAIFYNKKTMDESVFIFFPFYGYVDGAKVRDSDYHGYYWSSNLQVSGSYVYDDVAQNLEVNAYSPGWRQITGSRYFGESIRPVCD